MSGISVGNGLSKGVGLSVGSGFSRGGGLYFSGFSVAPTLSLNFTTMTALPSTITFSRPSNATYYDSTGKLTYAPNNLLLNSATLSTQNVTTAPINYILSFQGTGSVVLSGTFIGTLIGTGVSDRVFVAFTPTAGTLTLTVVGSVTSAQLEAVTYQTTPSTYVATTSAAYYGPRLDYNPVTLAARGLLIEEARTNLHKQSSFQSGYLTFGATLTANAGTSVDGTSDAASFVTDVTTGQHGTYYTPGLIYTAAVYTASVYAKKLGSANYYVNLDPTNTNQITQTAVFDLSTGTVLQVGSNMQSASIVDCGNGFYRLVVTFTPTALNVNPILYGCTSTSSRVFTGDGASGWLLFGWQVELGSFATSYIPTGASSVARSADTASMTGTNFSSWYNQTEGTFSANSETGGVTVAAMVGQVTVAAFSPNIDVARYQSGVVGATIFNVSQQSNLTLSPSIVFGQIYKTALAYKLNDVAGVANGGTVQTDTSANIPTVDQLQIGTTQNGYQLNGHLAYLVYYPQRLPNATLQSLTS